MLVRGVDGLQPDGSYAAGKTPSFGFAWSAPFDYDDLDVDPTATYDTHLGLSRYYNNNVDSGHHELRVDNPSWVMWTGDDPGAEHGYTSGELLDYAGSYALDADPSGDLPVLNGTVPDDLFYVPSYSGDGLFRKYGHVENSISRSDILSLDFDSMASSRFDEWVPLARGFEYRDLFSLRDASGGWVDPSVYADAETLYDVYRAVLTAQDPADASYLFGEGSLPLLDGLSEDDPVVDRIDAEYAEGLASFVEGHGDGSLYRLTYDMGFSNSYRCSAGSAGALDGTWTARTVSASKTDAVFDFRFVDFTFRDGTRTYVLPAASDPFDVTGDPTVPDSGQEGFPRWAAILLGCAVALLALLALSIFFPVFKGVLRGLLYVVQFVIDVVYVVLVWWWLALIRKARGEEIPPLWIFGK